MITLSLQLESERVNHTCDNCTSAAGVKRGGAIKEKGKREKKRRPFSFLSSPPPFSSPSLPVSTFALQATRCDFMLIITDNLNHRPLLCVASKPIR